MPELVRMLGQAQQRKLISADSKGMIEGVLRVADMTAGDVMIAAPRMDLIDIAAPLDEILDQVIDIAHSRYPVFEGERENIIGVLLAFPMKRRFINEDQLPFPEGRACGVVLDSLYNGEGGEGMYKAALLAKVAGLAAFYQAIVSDGWMKLIQFKLLRMDKWAGMTEPWVFHDRLDEYYYTLAVKAELWIPKILGTDFRVLGLRLTLDAAMVGVGGLMGMVVATSSPASEYTTKRQFGDRARRVPTIRSRSAGSPTASASSTAVGKMAASDAGLGKRSTRQYAAVNSATRRTDPTRPSRMAVAIRCATVNRGIIPPPSA